MWMFRFVPGLPSQYLSWGMPFWWGNPDKCCLYLYLYISALFSYSLFGITYRPTYHVQLVVKT